MPFDPKAELRAEHDLPLDTSSSATATTAHGSRVTAGDSSSSTSAPRGDAALNAAEPCTVESLIEQARDQAQHAIDEDCGADPGLNDTIDAVFTLAKAVALQQRELAALRRPETAAHWLRCSRCKTENTTVVQIDGGAACSLCLLSEVISLRAECVAKANAIAKLAAERDEAWRMRVAFESSARRRLGLLIAANPIITILRAHHGLPGAAEALAVYDAACTAEHASDPTAGQPAPAPIAAAQRMTEQSASDASPVTTSTERTPRS